MRASGLRLEHGLLLRLGAGGGPDCRTQQQLQAVVGAELRAHPPRPVPAAPAAWARVTVVPPLAGGATATVVRVGVGEALLTVGAGVPGGADLPAAIAAAATAASAGGVVTSTTVAAGVGGAGRVEVAVVVAPPGDAGGAGGRLSWPRARRLAAAVLGALRGAATAAGPTEGGAPAEMWAQTWAPDEAGGEGLLVVEALWVAPATDGVRGADAGAWARYPTPNLRGRAPEVPYERV